jgi:hypothetical protein
MGTHLISFSSKISKRNQNLFAIIVLLASIFYIFAPFERSKFIYEWIPEKDGNEVRLTLIKFEPDYFKLILPCTLAAQTNDWILEAKGGRAMQMSIYDENFVFLLGNTDSNEIDTYILENKNLASCEFYEIEFNQKQRLLTLTSDSTQLNQVQVSKNSRFEIASYIVWNENAASKNVVVTVETSSNLFIKKSFQKIFLDYFLFISITIFIFAALFKRKLNYNSFSFVKLYKSEIGAILYLVFIALTLYTILDDGLYLIEAKVLQSTGVLTQYLYPVPFPVGDIHFRLISLFLTEQPNILLLRLPSSIALFFTWVIFNRFWLRELIDTKNYRTVSLFSWGIWAFFSATFLVTLRPEGYVALILLISLVLITKYLYSGLTNQFLLSVPLVALALSLHQTGVLVLFLFIPAWIQIFWNRSYDKITFSAAVFNVSLSIYIFFFTSNIFIIVDKVREFESVNSWPLPFHESLTWNDPPWNEWKRVQHIFLADSLRFTAGAVALITAGFIIAILFKERNNTKNTNFVFNLSMLFSFIGLMVAPSKWVDHYAALLPTIIVFSLYIINSKHKKYSHLYLFLVATTAIIGINRTWVAGGKNIYSLDLNNALVDRTYSFFSSQVNMLIISLFFTLLLLISYLFARKEGNQTFLLVFPVVVFTFLVVRQITPTLLDSVIGGAGWTMNRQIIQGTYDAEKRCGVFLNADLEKNNIDSKELFAFTTPQDYAIYPCLTPTPVEAGIWIFPQYSVGNVHRWDQQRLMNRMTAETAYCFDSSPRFINDSFDKCIYRWNSEIPQMRLINS